MSLFYARRVSDLNDDFIDAAAELMAEAFERNPLLLPTIGGDISLAPVLFRAYIAATIVDGEAYFAEQSGDVVGVALWYGPGKGFMQSREQRHAGWNDFRGRLSDSANDWLDEYLPRLEALYSRTCPFGTNQSDTYQLMSMAVHTAFQGKGIGRMLIQEGIKRAKKQGAQVCLHAVTEEGVAIFRHFGFRVWGTELFASNWVDFIVSVLRKDPEA